MKKFVPLLVTALLFVVPALAYDDYDDERVSSTEAFYSLLVCGGLLLVGYIIGQVRAIRGLGMVLMGIGAFFGFCAAAVIVMNIVAEIVSVGVKIALVVGVIVAVGWILMTIYNAVTGKSGASEKKS